MTIVEGQEADIFQRVIGEAKARGAVWLSLGRQIEREESGRRPKKMNEMIDLYTELLDITRHWSRHDRVLPHEARAKEIGQRLCEIGGEGIMQVAFYRATNINPAASVLSLLWDGIGEWRW